MTSGKASKRKRRELAKAPPPVGRRGGGTASPKVLAAGAAAVAAVVAAIVGVVSLTGDGSGDQTAPTTRLPGATEVAQLFRGIPQSGVVLGKPSAPVTMVEYIDLQCPFCREFVVEAFPTLVEKYVRPGKLRIRIRGLYFLGPDSERGMKAAQAAAEQNRMFQFVDLLYRNQGGENSGWLSDDMVQAAARSITGLDVERLLSDAGSSAIAGRLAADTAQAQADGVQGTPTILVGPTGGEVTQVELASASDLASIERAIAAAAGT